MWWWSSWRRYRAWSPNHNGIKRRALGTIEGFFGAINLLGPRLERQTPRYKHWSTYFTFVQLKYEFLHGNRMDDANSGTCGTQTVSGVSGMPVIINRTFMTFYDVRAVCRGRPQPPHTHPSRCMQGESTRGGGRDRP